MLVSSFVIHRIDLFQARDSELSNAYDLIVWCT